MVLQRMMVFLNQGRGGTFMQPAEEQQPEKLEDLLRSGSVDDVEAMLDVMHPDELLHEVYVLTPDDQRRLLALLPPERAASLLEVVSDAYAADLIEEMPTEHAAPIVEELASDHRVDVLSELDADVREVVEDLTREDIDYHLLTVHYVYVVVRKRKLKGVIRIRDLVFADPGSTIGELAKEAYTVSPEASLNELENFFDEHDIAAVPVINTRGMMLGIVRRRAVLEALAERSEADSLKAAGIIGGDELRSMPVSVRSARRLSWLSVNIVLNIIAASVIALYEDTLTAVIALAVFLPIVSDMSGCSGNQAVAVSMRELTLGAALPRDVLRVWRKEASVGIINGVALGLLLGLAAWAWKGNAILGLVVGAALAINTVVAVSIGGTVPLLLKRFRFDPAVASGPLLTTVTDMCGFFLVLSLASLVLPAIS
jgi:magnesium transporter